MSWLRRLGTTLRPIRAEDDIRREIAFHVRERADELQAQGIGETEARQRAERQYGNVLLQAERTRDMNVVLIVDAVQRGVRYALRALRRTPGFTLTVLAQNRFRTLLLTLFAVSALTLACVGIYGTLSYAVSLRRREIGLLFGVSPTDPLTLSIVLLVVTIVATLAAVVPALRAARLDAVTVLREE